MPDAEYARSRHAAWLSAAALFTDSLGRVLLVKPTYHSDGRWLLPGGAAEPGESPHEACHREVREELRLDRGPGALLAVCWLGPGHPAIPAGMVPFFPGESRHVFDAGVLTEQDIDAIQLPKDELSEYAFVDSATAASRLLPADARLMLAALRARLGGSGTAYLAESRHHGTLPALERHGVHTRPRTMRPWHPGRVPADLPVPHAWGWLFVPDGRVVLVVDPDEPLAMLPGGRIEATDTSPEAALEREAYEEAALRIGAPTGLGWVYDETGEIYGGIGPCARLRLAAPVTEIGPAAVDPATGRTFARLLASPDQAAALLGWGDQGFQQAALAAGTAAQYWGIPTPAPGPITELPAAGGPV
ncbi:NUDIX hydrolase [Streptomyces sp. MP131-18]|uniref:NUDIX hydrolase n=1 Tax=Streptomyces sp. MP131-18 TaxID=1857892 RepID=UPI00097C6C41|nr:NUDIX hydrolase [Streptomyces sp. MP131-18]ONK13190.1 pyrimidine (deoxy)nucleoside triphosphate pyrophosphohydrolase [Streptomyces sp. MP131-18]